MLYFAIFKISLKLRYENNDFKSYWDLSTKQKNENDNFYEINGKNIYDIIKELEQYGLYDGGEWKKDTF